MDPDFFFSTLNHKIQDILENEGFFNHFPEHPWVTGSLGNPNSNIIFIALCPSRHQIENIDIALVNSMNEEAQWFASDGDKLFREALVENYFKDNTVSSLGGWNCYITNAIKEVRYANAVTGTNFQELFNTWKDVLRWEISEIQPKVIVAMGRRAISLLKELLADTNSIPCLLEIYLYTYITNRPYLHYPPNDILRKYSYKREFSLISQFINCGK